MRRLTTAIPGVWMLAICLILSACAIPRGAALRSEILRFQEGAPQDFQVVAVTRARIVEIAKWPATGWSGEYSWLPARRGPDAPVIRAGDQLHVVIWEAQENSLLTGPDSRRTEMPHLAVTGAGEVYLPYAGGVRVSGLTADGARAAIQDKLTAISPDVQVQIRVTQGRNNMADLVGGVATPGRYVLDTRDMPLLGLLALGGGIDPGLRHPLVRLIRGTRKYEIRAERLLSDPAANTLIRGGDQIAVVEDTRSFHALGATGAEQMVHYETEQMTAMQALSSLGGLIDNRADPGGVLILRDYPAKHVGNPGPGPTLPQVVFTIDLTTADGLFAARKFTVNPGDTIMVTETPVSDARTILGLLGSALGLMRPFEG